MPEMPEVETVRRTLYGKLLGKRIEQIEISRPRSIYYPDSDTFRAELEGAAFSDIQRRGKYLLLKLGPVTLICHLRMSGRLYVCSPDLPRGKHVHVRFVLADGQELRFEDQRGFGGFSLVGRGGEGFPQGLAELGPEPLEDAFTPAVLAHGFAGRKAPVKALLLDQRLLAGLGNIYVDEALFCAGVHPERLGLSIGPEEIERLYHCIRAILAKAIEKRGTTFSLYLDGEGKNGDMYEELQVFDRTGEPCPRCGTPIIKLAVAGRGSHVCPTCQAAPAGARLQPRGRGRGRHGDSVRVAAEPARVAAEPAKVAAEPVKKYGKSKRKS